MLIKLDELIATLPACANCQRRLRGVAASSEEFTRASTDLANGESGTCGICVGLLQETCVNAVVATINKSLGEYLLQPSSPVPFNVVLPPSAVFRQYLLCAYAETHGVEKLMATDLKDTLKYLIDRSGVEQFVRANGVPGARALPPLKVHLEGVSAADKGDDMCKVQDIAQGRGKKAKYVRGRKKRAVVAGTSDVVSIFDGLGPKEVAKMVGHNEFKNCLGIPGALEVKVTVSREPLFIKGQYLKYSRELSQTPWTADGKVLADGSVEELLTGKLVECYKAKGVKFSSAGREDVDVRMLGDGRAFCVEIIDPKTGPTEQGLQDCVAATNAATGLVEARHVAETDKKEVNRLGFAAERHRKVYSAVVWSGKAVTKEDVAKLESLKELKIEQKTPLRVLHRRTNIVRPRHIHWMKCEQHSPHFLTLTLETQAGTYIKEFVHGDLGRTTPSIKSILGNHGADIMQLDVVGLTDE